MTPIRRNAAGAAVVMAILSVSDAAAALPMRVVSLDQCADQFVLALAGEDVVALSHRADDPDSRLRSRVAGLPLRRASSEAILAVRPTVVVRYWGGDLRLTQALERRGVRVATIQEASDFDGVRANVRTVAAALGQRARGEGLIANMDRRLARSRGAWGGAPALYLTPGAYTAGAGTLIDALLRWTGLRNLATSPGYAPAPTEAVVLSPPRAVVRGFFDQIGWTRWSPGRHPTLARVLRVRTVADLPADVLGCPAWFVAEGAETLAAAAPSRRQ